MTGRFAPEAALHRKHSRDGHGRLTGSGSRLGSCRVARAAHCFGMRVYWPTPPHSGNMGRFVLKTFGAYDPDVSRHCG